MKALAITLALVMSATPVMAQVDRAYYESYARQSGKPVESIYIQCLAALAILGLASYYVIKVSVANCDMCKNKRLILMKSDCGGPWMPIMTNDVVGVCTNKWDVFSDQYKGSCNQFKIIVTDIP